MKKYSFLKESYGEYPEIDKDLAHWYGAFKLWWSENKAYMTWFKSCKEYEKESKMINDVIVGLNIKVYAIPTAERNAFVIPGFYVGCDDNVRQIYKEYRKDYPKHNLYNPFCIGNDFFSVLIASQLGQLIKMRKFSYVNDPMKKGKKKIIFKNVTTPISVFVTYGMLNAATPEERIGVYLHEIGHWVDAALKIPSHVIDHPTTESIFLASNMTMARFCTRYQELTADKFAKDLGYGAELSKALDSLVNVRKNVSWYYKYKDWTQKGWVEAQNRAEEEGDSRYANASTYPSMATRKKYLEDED